MWLLSVTQFYNISVPCLKCALLTNTKFLFSTNPSENVTMTEDSFAARFGITSNATCRARVDKPRQKTVTIANLVSRSRQAISRLLLWKVTSPFIQKLFTDPSEKLAILAISGWHPRAVVSAE